MVTWFFTSLGCGATDGDIVVGGALGDAITFGLDASGVVWLIESTGCGDPFVARNWPEGTARWVRSLARRSGSRAEAVAAAPDGALVAAGGFDYAHEAGGYRPRGASRARRRSPIG